MICRTRNACLSSELLFQLHNSVCLLFSTTTEETPWYIFGNYSVMPYYWDDPEGHNLRLLTVSDTNAEDADAESASDVVEEIDDATAAVTPLEGEENNLTTHEIMGTIAEKPEKNMQPFRETVSEFEMFTRAG